MIGAAAQLAEIAEALHADRPDLAERVTAIAHTLAPHSEYGRSLQERDRLIIALAPMYSGRPHTKAVAIVQDSRRFAATWSRLRHMLECPGYFANRPQAVFWQLHRNEEIGGAKWPVSIRTIEATLQLFALDVASDPLHTDDERTSTGDAA